MSRKRANGEGSISFDKRRKRYRAKVTTGWEINEKTGKERQITKDIGSNFKTQSDAAQAIAAYLENPYNLEDKNITFSKLYERWFEEFIVDHESHRYRIKAAYKYCGSLYNKKIREISIYDMKNAIATGTTIETRGKNKGQRKTASPAIKESMKYLFNHLLQYATEARLIERNYAKDFTLDKKILKKKEEQHVQKIPFTQEDLQIMWRAVDFVPFADMIWYACYSGWRPSELVTLKIENVDLEKGFIRGGIKTDAGRDRIVPIHPKAKPIIEKYYDEAVKVGSKYLFNDTNKKKGIGLSYDQYLSRFNNAMELLKFLDHHTPHCTRHTFISMAKASEMNEHVLKLIVGHKERDLTEHVYTHRELQELKNEIKKIK